MEVQIYRTPVLKVLSGGIACVPQWMWAWLPFNCFKIASLEFLWYFPMFSRK